MRLPFALLLAAGPLLALAQERGSHVDLSRDAEAAYRRKDYATALTAASAALQLRPDSPRILHRLATLSALTRDPSAALGYLNRLAALGVSLPLERDPDLAALQGTPPFLRLLQQFAANRAPQGEAEVWVELPGRTGIIEGIAFRPRTGDFFFADVHHRGIWRRDRTGGIFRFSAEDDELLGIFGLAIDEARNTLWAAMSAVPEMEGFTAELAGAAGLAEFDLATSELRRVIPALRDGRDHGFGDLLVTPDGTVYVTDSKAPVIWKLTPGGEELEKLAESPLFISLQGIVLWQHEVIVADYSNGLLAVDPATGAVRSFAPPPGVTLLGIDGLVAIPDGIVAIQNGVEPQRVVRIAFTPGADAIASFTVLASALPHLTDLGLVTLVEDRPTVVANSGWEDFDARRTGPAAARTVRLFQVPTTPPAPAP